MIIFRGEKLQLAQWPQILQRLWTRRVLLTTSSSSGSSSCFKSQWPQLFLCLSMFKSCVIANSICALQWPITIYTDWTLTIHTGCGPLASIRRDVLACKASPPTQWDVSAVRLLWDELAGSLVSGHSSSSGSSSSSTSLWPLPQLVRSSFLRSLARICIENSA